MYTMIQLHLLLLSVSIYTHLTFSFIFGVGMYFIVGAIIMKVKYDATGTDLIPNKNFWLELPHLFKVYYLECIVWISGQIQCGYIAMISQPNQSLCTQVLCRFSDNLCAQNLIILHVLYVLKDLLQPWLQCLTFQLRPGLIVCSPVTTPEDGSSALKI